MKIINNRYVVLLCLFFCLTYLLPLNSRLLWQPDETRYAEISREMLQRGDWLVPELLGVRYFEKPVAGYWVNNISQWLLGDSNFAVRFGVVFCSLLSAALLFWLALKLWHNWRTAWIASLIYLSSLLVFGTGTYSVLDPMLALWMTAAMAGSYFMLNPGNGLNKVTAAVLLGLACGMGFMTKGFLALVLPVIALLPVVIWQRKIKELITLGPVAIVSALLLSAPWALTIASREPDFWRYFFWVEHIQRLAADNAQHKAPFWYYLPVLCAATLPWTGFLPGALTHAWRRRSVQPELFFLLSWVLMPLLFFSIAKGKLLTYILPCMAPLALLIAASAIDAERTGQTRLFKANSIINLATGSTCMLIILLMAYGTAIPDFGRYFTAVSLFSPAENSKVIMALTTFAFWGLAGYWSGRNESRHWQWAAVCPLLLSLFIAWMLPEKIMDNKQPQHFIRHHTALLAHSRYVLADNVGFATGLAWELKRSDILMIDERGELSYGLDYPDAAGRLIDNSAFPAWLVQARTQGDVSVVLQLDEGETMPGWLPVADEVRHTFRMALLWYKKQP